MPKTKEKKLPYKTTNLKILIGIPTYRRAGDVPTLSLFDDAVLFVDKEEKEEYRKKHPEANIVEYKGRKGLTPKLNFMLDYGRENGYDVLFKMDDDFEALAYFAGGRTERLFDKDRIYQVIERIAVMAMDGNMPLFSFQSIPDIRRYKRTDPFSLFTTLKIGAYGMLLDNKLKFDERFVMKQDIDMCLQVLLNYRIMLVENRYTFYYRPTMGNKGGVASYRTKALEREMIDLLTAKWGHKSFTNTLSERVSVYTVNIANPFKN